MDEDHIGAGQLLVRRLTLARLVPGRSAENLSTVQQVEKATEDAFASTQAATSPRGGGRGRDGPGGDGSGGEWDNSYDAEAKSADQGADVNMQEDNDDLHDNGDADMQLTIVALFSRPTIPRITQVGLVSAPSEQSEDADSWTNSEPIGELDRGPFARLYDPEKDEQVTLLVSRELSFEESSLHVQLIRLSRLKPVPGKWSRMDMVTGDVMGFSLVTRMSSQAAKNILSHYCKVITDQSFRVMYVEPRAGGKVLVEGFMMPSETPENFIERVLYLLRDLEM